MKKLSFCALCFGLTPLMSFADYRCSLNADLRGLAPYFMYFGVDAYLGEGSWICQNEKGQTESQQVLVALESTYGATGSSANSTIKIIVGNILVKKPNAFLGEYATSLQSAQEEPNSTIAFRVKTNAKDVTLLVIADHANAKGMEQSLLSGKLTITPLGSTR